MAEADPADLPLAPLEDLFTWLSAEKVPGVLIGGVAVALVGRPRVTRDVDAVLLLPEERWAPFLASGASFGFVPRITDALAFAAQSRVLLVHHQPSGINVDLSLGSLPFEEELHARARIVEVAGVRIPLPTPEDLIILKAVAHRDRDLADIEGLLDAHPRLDLRRVRRWVRDFAAVLEAPELLDDLEALLSRRPRRRKGKGKS